MTTAAMAERRGWTTAVRRWRPRRSEKRRGRVSLGSGEPNAHGYTVYGGGTCPSHGDGLGGGAPASLRTTLALTEGCQRAWEEVVRCWGGGGAMAVVMEWLDASWRTVMATAELRELGCCCGEEERPRQSKWGGGMARADAGGVKAAPRRVVACAVMALATRGRRRGHAAFALWRRSATERLRFSSSVATCRA